ncbi:hypothetical protein DFP74_2567 [Nocardiopsis sp. Huas11]|uniref:DUF6507 family protein n=1 Tax=Nocardiopsis sp. Huas11 TaxID=2183912 RepID=UPI000EB1112F|nr:DUF6507 family protein [Nocardiopsis sp. Huas11]RKS06917.1 hypothetical protein DFP74_2567 [Nocardiopsis sp. Huas11]
MSTWDIQPSEVGGVLTTVSGFIGEEGGSECLVGCMEKIEARIVEISEEANSGPVSIALGEFAEVQFGVMGGMASLTVSALTGASEATTHYVEGNLTMAAEAQAGAGEVPEPENLPEPQP